LKTRIFLVEDENIVAEDLRERLEKNNYEVVGIADSGKTAIDQVQQLRPDLLLMDVRVKGELNGIETAIVIQSYFEKPIPVVFLTGFSEKSFPYLKVLNDYIYINKPYSEDLLLTAIDRALKQKQNS
jgi:two-component system, response regulator PdtaR